MNETLPKLVLTPDVPAFITLCFDTPKEGDIIEEDKATRHWWMFQVKNEDETRFKYFPPPAIAPVMCLASKGTTFTLLESAKIVDGKARKITNIYEGWVDVATATPIPLVVEAPPQTSPTAPPVSRTAPPVTRPPGPPTTPSQSRPSVPSTPQKQAVRLSDVANTMEACIIVAQGIAAAWPEEQQQDTAVSMFICLTRDNHVFLTREQVKATAVFYAGGIPKEATKYGGEDDGSVDYEPPEDEDMFGDQPPSDDAPDIHDRLPC